MKEGFGILDVVLRIPYNIFECGVLSSYESNKYEMVVCFWDCELALCMHLIESLDNFFNDDRDLYIDNFEFRVVVC